MGFLKNQFCKYIEWEDKSSDNIALRFITEGDKEINKNTKINVAENQLVVFVIDGQITDVFWPGNYKLSDESNLAITSSFLNWNKLFDTPYMGDVYFFNTSAFLNQKWATIHPVYVNDIEQGETKISSFGSYSYNVINPEVIIEKVFSSKPLLRTYDLENSLRKIIYNNIARIITESGILVKDASSSFDVLSQAAMSVLKDGFNALGLELCAFNFDKFTIEIDEVVPVLNNDTEIKQIRKQPEKPTNSAPINNLQYTMSQLNYAKSNTLNGGGLSINDAFIKAKGQQQVNKAEERRECPKCHTMVKISLRFCPNCGTEVNAKKICNNCGAEINSAAKYCPECGKTVTDNIDEIKKNCLNCGAQIKPGAKFCPECGASVLNTPISVNASASHNVTENSNPAINTNQSINQNREFDGNLNSSQIEKENSGSNSASEQNAYENNSENNDVLNQTISDIDSSFDEKNSQKADEERENLQSQSPEEIAEKEDKSMLSQSGSAEEIQQTENMHSDNIEEVSQSVQSDSVSESMNSVSDNEAENLSDAANTEIATNDISENISDADIDNVSESVVDENRNMDLSSENQEVSINSMNESSTEENKFDDNNNLSEYSDKNEFNENNSVPDEDFEMQSSAAQYSNADDDISQKKFDFQHDIEMMKKIIVESDGVAKENSLQSSAFKSDIQNIYQNEQTKMPSSDNAVPFTSGGVNQNTNNDIQSRLQQNINISRSNVADRFEDNSDDDKKK